MQRLSRSQSDKYQLTLRSRIMNKTTLSLMVRAACLGFLLGTAGLANATIFSQCPGDLNSDGDNTDPGETADPNVQCMHVSAGDGYIKMADETPMYMFSYDDVTGIPDDQVMTKGILSAAFPAPIIILDQGREFYLTLSNVGMIMRPDLFDPHTVHFHGFPQASTIFDGVPDVSISINMGASLTYYYNIEEPGTYAWHCHVEATEHMQMGMLGNLYVRPAQNKLPDNTDLNGFNHQSGFQYAYNDGDGSTYYDVEFPIQLSSFDSTFHKASETVQPLPFALMKDDYAMLNGRGYPDTLIDAPLPSVSTLLDPGIPYQPTVQSQREDSLIEITQGQKALLRITSMSVTRIFSLNLLGIPMQVIARGARQHVGPGDVATRKELYHNTHSITVAGGEAIDVLLDTTDISPGKYYLYTSNLNYLSNGSEDFGGMMTEIIVNPI